MSHFQVIPAAYLLLTRDASSGEPEVLLQLRGPGTTYMAGHWACGAAGHIEHGESAASAIAREAVEELGITVDPAGLVPLCAVQRTTPGCAEPVEQRVDFFLVARAWSGEPTIQEPGKCSELRWCRGSELPQLPEPLVPHEREVLARFFAEDVPPFLSLGFA